MNLTESTLSKLIGTSAGGQGLVNALHKTYKLSNDAKFDPIDKISWSWFKANRDNFAILVGATGSAGIKTDRNDMYIVVAVGEDGQVHETRDSRGGNVLDFIKSVIGKTRKIYAARRAVEQEKIQKRQQQTPAPENATYNPDILLKKLRPMIAAYTEKAMASVEGVAIQMIKSGNYTGASKRLDRLQRLSSIVTSLDVEDRSKIKWDTREIRSLSDVLDKAVKAAYGESNPEGLRQQTDWRGRPSGVDVDSSEKFMAFANGLVRGDQKSLGTVMAYFKQMIAAG